MIELIPAIDIIEGKCVRLTKGDYNDKTVYSDAPLQMAKRFESLGMLLTLKVQNQNILLMLKF